MAWRFSGRWGQSEHLFPHSLCASQQTVRTINSDDIISSSRVLRGKSNLIAMSKRYSVERMTEQTCSIYSISDSSLQLDCKIISGGFWFGSKVPAAA
jgi:hypothetical protein